MLSRLHNIWEIADSNELFMQIFHWCIDFDVGYSGLSFIDNISDIKSVTHSKNGKQRII